MSNEEKGVYLTDSFPISLAQNQHAYRAQVAAGLVSISYNSTKKMYYQEVKAPLVARRRPGKLPDLELLRIEETARQEGPTFDLCYRITRYSRPSQSSETKKLHPEQQTFSKAVSRIRQPIEAFFAWINRHTGIQDTGLVGSTAGLLTHIFGKFVAALLFRVYPQFGF